MNYYNEIDSKACAWLRALINEGLIPNGYVDERSIIEIQPADLEGYTQCHFFAGIAGWCKALQLAGWPEDKPVWTASCPCQPLSCAGLGKGHADERHLWPALYRLIAERKPATIIGEQVASKDGREWFAGIRADLEGMGYAVGGADLCSAGVGAPNIRQRLYWVAESNKRECRRFTNGEGCNLNRETTRRIESNGKFESGCSNGRLADADVGQSSDGELQRSGEHLQRDEDASAGRLVEPVSALLERHTGNGDDRHEPGRNGETTTGPVAETGESGGMGQSNGTGSYPRSETTKTTGHRHTTDAANFWSDSIWHLCRDGKHRRIPAEPAFFPLAARLPGRVAMLRGFGNAINPVIASELIKAYLETLTV